MLSGCLQLAIYYISFKNSDKNNLHNYRLILDSWEARAMHLLIGLVSGVPADCFISAIMQTFKLLALEQLLF